MRTEGRRGHPKDPKDPEEAKDTVSDLVQNTSQPNLLCHDLQAIYISTPRW